MMCFPLRQGRECISMRGTVPEDIWGRAGGMVTEYDAAAGLLKQLQDLTPYALWPQRDPFTGQSQPAVATHLSTLVHVRCQPHLLCEFLGACVYRGGFETWRVAAEVVHLGTQRISTPYSSAHSCFYLSLHARLTARTTRSRAHYQTKPNRNEWLI